MAEVIYMDKEAMKKLKRVERKQKFEQTKEWFKENGVTLLKVTLSGAVVLVPVGLSIAGQVTKARINRRLEKIERNKDLRIYDRSLGCFLQLKRKLSSKELATINERKINGEHLVNILSDMKLLK